MQKLSFLGFQKLPSFNRQKDKILRQVVRFKKDVHIVIEHNSIFFEILMVDFELFRDSAGQKHQNLRIIPREPRNLGIIATELNGDFDLIGDSAGQEHQNLRIIPREPRNLGIITVELNGDFDI